MPLPASAGTMPLPALPLQSPIAGAVPFTPVSYSGTPHSVTGSDLQDTVSVDNEENTQPDRTSKRLRLNWTELEDSRLVRFFYSAHDVRALHFFSLTCLCWNCRLMLG
jgi:hypothetical protein